LTFSSSDGWAIEPGLARTEPASIKLMVINFTLDLPSGATPSARFFMESSRRSRRQWHVVTRLSRGMVGNCPRTAHPAAGAGREYPARYRRQGHVDIDAIDVIEKFIGRVSSRYSLFQTELSRNPRRPVARRIILTSCVLAPTRLLARCRRAATSAGEPSRLRRLESAPLPPLIASGGRKPPD
jgi:hypothetical protein